MSNSIKAKKWEYLTEVHPDAQASEKLPGVPFCDLFPQIKAADVKYIKVTFEEVVDWDIAAMRGFFHGVQIPAFTKEFNNAYKNEKACVFHRSEVKDYLKAKFLGWVESGPAWDKWHKMLPFGKPIENILDFLKLQEMNATFADPIQIKSSEGLEPVEYWELLNSNEAYFFERFNTMYDKRKMPEKPGG